MKLFKGIVKDNTNAFIGFKDTRVANYIIGYLDAAERLSNDFGSLNESEKSSQIYPIIFLYRHYIELSLKDIIKALYKPVDKDKDEENKKILSNHRLLPLWGKAISLVKEYINDKGFAKDYPCSDWDKLKSIIKEFDQLDGSSFTFRYATTKKDSLLLPDFDYISLDNFKTEISKVNEVIEKMRLIISLGSDL